jgi:hypothetical protein
MAEEDVLNSFFSEISDIAPEEEAIKQQNENKEILTVAAPGLTNKL